MDRRTVVVFVGDDASAGERVSRAVDTAWEGPDGPTFRALAPADLDADRDGAGPLNATRGVVVTAAATTDGVVRDRLRALPSNVPVIALVEDATTTTIRALLLADVNDVVEAGRWDSTVDGSGDDARIVECLASRVNPDRVRLGGEDVARLAEVLLDAGTTLMSTRTDEVGTKIEWTIQNVGEHTDLDRIVCYRKDDGQFVPAYSWCLDGFDSAPRAFEEFPESDQLSTFANVARPSAAPATPGGGSVEAGERSPATVRAARRRLGTERDRRVRVGRLPGLDGRRDRPVPHARRLDRAHHRAQRPPSGAPATGRPAQTVQRRRLTRPQEPAQRAFGVPLALGGGSLAGAVRGH